MWVSPEHRSGASKRRRAMIVLASALALIIVFAVASTYAPSPVDFFPVLKEPSQTGYPLQLCYGRLVVENGCVRLRSPFPTYGFLFGPTTTPIWPYGYSVDVEGARTVIRDEKGNVVAHIGDFVRAGGGSISPETVEQVTGKPLPDKRRGPYSVISGVTIQ